MTAHEDPAAHPAPGGRRPPWRQAAEVAVVAGRLGLTSFGGPTAHPAYFRREYVTSRGWIREAEFAETMALCQLLPGPSSSQLGVVIGYQRAGLSGALASWVGFTAPSALAMAALAAFGASAGLADSNAVRALMCLAVAIVANAVIDMGRAFWTGPTAIGLGAGVFALTLAGLSTYAPVAGIALSAGIGALVMRRQASGSLVGFTRTPSRRAGAAMLLAVPIIGAALWSLRDDSWGYLASAMFNAGSLVIGGGHVVLPLLEASVGPLVDPEAFLAGYGMAQAMPGPLFTFSTYLGHLVGGPAVALLATFAIFLPGLLLALGTLPFWAAVRHAPAAGGAVAGASAAVVGLLAATLVHPLLTETVIDGRTALLAAALFATARWARPPIWMLLAGTLAASLLLG